MLIEIGEKRKRRKEKKNGKRIRNKLNEKFLKAQINLKFFPYFIAINFKKTFRYTELQLKIYE